MQVILMERIEKLGQMGEVVTVKPGYARNYLFSQGKARRATKENCALFDVANRRRCESGYPRCNFYPRHVKQSLAPNLC